jgi:ferredoxin--NADP+ reductase
MSSAPLGSAERPLRVAVVGAGPAGFYTAEALLKQAGLHVDVDLLERLPAPYGLLRYGVAPDHPKIKGISAAYDRIAADARVRFLGNVDVGHGPVGVADLLACYDRVVFAIGCETDRHLGIRGEDLDGSHPATSFVAWYNGHPDHAALPVRFESERAVVVGIGDVAMDLARILLRDPEDLASTDIADRALAILRGSRVREVVILARRGPAQAAFAAKELEDIGELPGVDVHVDVPQVRADLAAMDPHAGHDRHKLEVLAALGEKPKTPAHKRLVLRFLASPSEIVGDGGRVGGVVVEETELVRDSDGRVSARGTGRLERLDTGLVVHSVGYRGVAVPGLPFDESHGILPNSDGRLLDGATVMPRLYAAGWIKRGASGVVGTNKGDAAATVARLVEDLASGSPLDAGEVGRAAIDGLLRARAVRVVSWEGWKAIDRAERERGQAAGKVREKFSSIEELLAAAGV